MKKHGIFLYSVSKLYKPNEVWNEVIKFDNLCILSNVPLYFDIRIYEQSMQDEKSSLWGIIDNIDLTGFLQSKNTTYIKENIIYQSRLNGGKPHTSLIYDKTTGKNKVVLSTVMIEVKSSRQSKMCAVQEHIPGENLAAKAKLSEFGVAVFLTLLIATLVVCVGHIFLDRARNERYKLLDQENQEKLDYLTQDAK